MKEIKNRDKKVTIKAEEGIELKVLNETKDDLEIKAVLINNENYANPPIPKGYKHVCGEWHNGFVIERETDGSQFVWIPVGYLDCDGTLDGKSFTEKFGRRNYKNVEFSENKFHESLTSELVLQIKSVEERGGFYISRYNISRNTENEPQSKKSAMPWLVIFNEAKRIATLMEMSIHVSSHLTYGAEYDSVLAWFIKSGAKTLKEITNDSTKWGNHWNTPDSPRAVLQTGDSQKWSCNNIYDFAGNVDEWTQEQFEDTNQVIRGGSYEDGGNIYPVDSRICGNPYYDYNTTGFRVALYIKEVE